MSLSVLEEFGSLYPGLPLIGAGQVCACVCVGRGSESDGAQSFQSHLIFVISFKTLLMWHSGREAGDWKLV